MSTQTSGKKRLILDLRNVNKHIWKQSVKYDYLKIALSYLEKDFYSIRFDITSAYHFCEMFYPHTEFLCFSWLDTHGKRVFYKFLVLPFGLNSAYHYFTKLTRPSVAKWRGEDKLVLMYLDDGSGCAPSFKRAFELGCESKSDLLKSGFVPKVEKCVWEPVQCLEFLGCNLNSEEGTICIPERRIFKAQCPIFRIVACTKSSQAGTSKKSRKHSG